MRFLSQILVAGFLLTMVVACAQTKTLDVWKDESRKNPLGKVMVVAVSTRDILRKQFENVLSDRLAKQGVEAVASHKVFPALGPDLDPDAAMKKVKELGVESIMLIRSINKKEITNHQRGGSFFAPTSINYNGWYSYYTGSLVFVSRSYDTTYYTVVTSLYDVDADKPFWHYISEARVEGSHQGAINEFIPNIIEQLENGKLLP
jgi:hypothetical protein